MELAGVCLITDNVPALASFYKKVLEAESEGDDVYTMLKTRGTILSIFSRKAMESLNRFPTRNTGINNFVMAFRASDLDAEYKRIKKLNPNSLKPPAADPVGNLSFSFTDPDGNIIDVVPPM